MLHFHDQTGARLGELTTPHGSVTTPCFMPVGTYGVVKGVPPHHLQMLPVQMTLVNAYHLMARPGEKILCEHGGIHGFTSWNGPILADSGGYQVYSLRRKVQITEEGCQFRDPLSGNRRWVTPEGIVAFMERVGVDVGMVLDVCPAADASPRKHEEAVERTLNWAARSLSARDRREMALFGIVQGGGNPALRRKCAEMLVAQGFDGYAIGGLGIGEKKTDTWSAVDAATGSLPVNQPRYLMGMGYPEDILKAVTYGVDLFDCVLPTRNARNGQIFTSKGRINFKQSGFLSETGPPDEECSCPVCRRYSLGYLCHLYHMGDMGSAVLATVHNLWYYLDFMARVRHTIGSNLPLGGLK